MSIEEQYESLKKRKFPIEEIFKFSKELTNSKNIEYHFHLLFAENKMPYLLYKDLKTSIFLYGEEALTFLEEKMNSDNINEAVFASNLLSSVINHSHNNIDSENLLNHLRKFIKIEDCELRPESIMSLGLVGNEDDINTFCNLLLNDSNDSSRALAVSALSLLSERLSKEIIQKNSCESLKLSLTNEKSKLVVAHVIATIQQLWDTKFGISIITPATIQSDKLIKARNKALKLLNKHH